VHGVGVQVLQLAGGDDAVAVREVAPSCQLYQELVDAVGPSDGGAKMRLDPL